MWKGFPETSSRGDDGLEGENPERARECIFARKRFPATLGGILCEGMTSWRGKSRAREGMYFHPEAIPVIPERKRPRRLRRSL